MSRFRGKKLLRHPGVQSVLAAMVACYIRLTLITARTHRAIDAQAAPFAQGDRQALFVFWHGRLFLCAAFRPPQRSMHVLISGHRDGMLISRLIAHFGIATVEGSSSKGGGPALRTLMRLMRDGGNVAITPDGPRGPAGTVAPGIVYLAKRSGLPVVPVAYSASRARRLKSWDRFMVPFPFSRVALVVGPPLMLAQDEEDTAGCERVAEALRHATAQADQLTGAPA